MIKIKSKLYRPISSDLIETFPYVNQKVIVAGKNYEKRIPFILPKIQQLQLTPTTFHS